jgi:hypothetical protein
MSNANYPSVTVSERMFIPSQSVSQNTTTSGAFIGRSNQGPTAPTLVTSWSNFTSLYGVNYTDLHYAVNDFFANGGRQAYISRIAGISAVAAELDVFDKDAADTSGTPLFTATVTNPGTWGNQLRLVTSLRDAANYRFDVSLFRIPIGVTFDPTLRNSEYLIDQWADVTLDPVSTRYLYAVVNSPSSTGSQLVSFSGQSYDPDTPAVRPMPGDIAGAAFTGGVAGEYTGGYDAAASYSLALESLSPVRGPLILNLPGMTTPAIVKSAIGEAASRGDTFVVVDTTPNLSPAAAVAYLNTDLSLSTLSEKAPSHAAVYYPHLHMPSIGSAAASRTTLRPPGGAVAGLMIATDVTVGPWKAPAGLSTGISDAIAVERQLTSAELTVLNESHINAIRSIPGAGVVVMGARTAKTYGLDRYVNVRRTVIEVSETLKNSTAFALFENNDERLWGQLTALCSAYLASVWQAGGLRGASAEQAYFVRCDETNNTPSSVGQGSVNIEIGLAPLTPAEFIIINIGQFDGGSSASVAI